MPKAITTAPPGGFNVVLGSGPPDIVRRAGALASPVADTMKGMPAPANGQVAEFFVAVSVPDSITDPEERDQALKEEARKTSNRLSGIARRVTKGDASAAFALRMKTQPDGTRGVVVYRVAPGKNETKAKTK